MTKYKGYINSIETMGLVDGPGIRIVIFMQGCPLRCVFCHNPETWRKTSALQMTPEEVVEKILRYKNYFEGEGGVTFSGGEPLFQPEFLLETLKLCKKNGIHTALDTAGVGTFYEEILQYTDLVIWDCKAYNEEDYFRITGHHIDTSLQFLSICQKLHKKMWIRQVIIPGVNDRETYIEGLISFIHPLRHIEKVELLPYETLGVSKYDALGIPYRLKDIKAMNLEECKRLDSILQEGLCLHD